MKNINWEQWDKDKKKVEEYEKILNSLLLQDCDTCNGEMFRKIREVLEKYNNAKA